MNLVICDDNPQATDRLQQLVTEYCAQNDFPCQVTTVTHAPELLKLDFSGIHVLFLDIDMPKLNGIEVAKHLRLKYPDLLIVFVTSWIKYAPQGYQVSAFRYLMKIRLEEELAPCLDAAVQKLFRDEDRILLHRKSEPLYVQLKHILYLAGTPRRTTIFHTCLPSYECIECIGKLSDYEAKLEEKPFFRIQRSYLVNMQHIKKMLNYQVYLSNGEVLRTNKQSFSSLKAQYLLWRGANL